MRRLVIWTLFVEKEAEETWKRLKKWFNNISSRNPITKEYFFEMYEGREHLLDWDKCPPGIEDFPVDIQKAIQSYGKFQDKLEGDIGYLGKDFTLFPVIVQVERIEDESLFLEALLQLDALYIEKSRKDMEAARAQAKRGKQ